MAKYRIIEDSVVGQRCFIVYEGVRPVITLWEDALNYEKLKTHLNENVRLEDLEEIGAVHDVTVQLGGTREDARAAIEAWLEEKGWLEPRNPS